MNRIILIGNGFDLAHGLETKYEHFINNFWRDERDNYIDSVTNQNNVLYENDFIKIEGTPHQTFLEKYYLDSIGEYEWFNKISEKPWDDGFGHIQQVKITHKNNFLEKISENLMNKNWVDVEEEYYKELHECLKDKKNESVKKLNEEFLAVQKALEEYLTEQQKNKDLEINNDIFTSIFYEKDISEQLLNPTYSANYNKIDKTINILFLSFNYTDTEKIYIDKIYNNRGFDKNKIKCIHIHGELNDKKNNPIIFGYGDEEDDNYKLILKKAGDYLENIKSVKYRNATKFEELQTFINSGQYEILIMGHSCGISDITLLSKLFKHENCKLVKPFYYKHKDEKGKIKDNYNDIVKNIYRIFSDSKLIDEKLAIKSKCDPLINVY